MLVLLLILVPTASAGLILIIKLLRPGFSHFWLLAVLGSLTTWIISWFIRPEAPLYLPLANWQPLVLIPISPALLLDSKSWPFLIALTTLILAALVTDVTRPEISRTSGYWLDLLAYLLLTAFSVLAVLSGNTITLLLSWTLLAGIVLALRMSKIQHGTQSREVVVAFAIHLASIGCVVWAGVIAFAAGSPLSFTTIAPQMSALLLVAAGINLGAFPLHTPIPKDDEASAGMNAMFRLTTSAPALVLLVRVGMAGAPDHLEGLFLLMAGLALIYGGLAWAGAPGMRNGISFWLICLASLALASAAHGQSAASMAWGIAALFTGGLLNLATVRLRGVALLWLLGLISISALPFSPTWAGAGLYAPPFQPMMIVLLIGQSLFLVGTLRHALRLPSELLGAERWVGSLYLSGLLLLLTSHFTVTWFLRLETEMIGQYQTGWIETGISMIALGLAVLTAPVYFRRPRRKGNRLSALTTIFELAWLYRYAGSFYRVAERIITGISAVIEGRAGILWTLLVLALLVSLFASLGQGG